MQEEIGKPAGAIWDGLNTRGEQSLSELKKAVKGEGTHLRLGHRVAGARKPDAITPEKRTFRIRLRQEHAKATGVS